MSLHMLADTSTEVIEAIVMVVVMLLAGLGHMFKKKTEAKDGKVITIPPPEEEAPPAAESRAGRPTETIVLQRPVRSEKSVQPPATVRPRAPRTTAPQPAARRAAPPETPRRRRMTPAEHAAQIAAHARRVTRQLQERAAAQPERQVHQSQPREHAARVAAHAEQVANHLRRERLRQDTLDRVDTEQVPSQQVSIPNPQALRQAVLLSEILQPPLSIRHERMMPW